ncbi:hypothetical protein SAMN05444337_0184 [Flavobacterium haoranii]|uniref:DUF2200 domain-containing protein n=2 Tax=Flavobacterium haoranii TaxID=683124 RepID=A0A1M6BRU1_9FLAO|nr:hypothetical protein SAMN05444337_0184 [Flavobacterium haoranii]
MILKFDAKIIILVDSLLLSIYCFLYLVLIISKMNNLERVYKMSFASVYQHYIAKAEKKNRTKEEVNTIIFWLTGYNEKDLENIITTKVNFEDFFNHAPQINPNVSKITGVICGYRVEEIEDKIMQKVRYLDKLIDELAKDKKMEKILRE